MKLSEAPIEETRKAYLILVTKDFAVPEPTPDNSNKLSSVLRWLTACVACGVNLDSKNRHGLTILRFLGLRIPVF